MDSKFNITKLRKMKNTTIFIICLCIFIVSCKETNVDNTSDQLVTQEDVLANISLSDDSGDRIPILAWNGIDRFSSESMYKDLADAGFTINLPLDLITPDAEKAKLLFSALDKAAAANLKQIIGAAWLDYLSEQEVARLKAHRGLAGYYFGDEPTTYDELTSLKTWVDRVKLIDNEHLLYINLAGCDCRSANWAPELIGCTEHEPSPCARFVKTVADDIDIPMISFDRYPVILDTITFQPKLMPDWFYTLKIMAREAKRTNKELWAFASSTEITNAGTYNPVPTMNGLRLQMYTNLAYGTQTLQYYTYKHVRSHGKAPLAADGSKTISYYMIKKMNEELIALSPVFFRSKVNWVAHTGIIPYGATELDKSKLPKIFNSLDIKGGSGALVSLIEKGEDNFLVVVNHDIHGTVSVKATGSENLYRINKKGEPVMLGDNTQQLEPGDLCIYFWKKQ